MEILVAKNSGFCFGVKNAVDKAYQAANGEASVFTYGPIIHNEAVVGKLKEQGIDVIEDLNGDLSGKKIIIRSHGIAKAEYDRLNESDCEIIDATCPYVKNIHKIVCEKSSQGYKVIIIGNPEHPEVKGVKGWCMGECILIDSEKDIDEEIKGKLDKVCVVAQTTYNIEKWKQLIMRLVILSKEITIYNTICAATDMRQKEAKELSNKVDIMIVVGGKESSNTKKLYEICKENCKEAIFIQDADELNLSLIKDYNRVGVTAGASTPDFIINDVVEKIKGINDSKGVKKMDEIKEVKMESMEDYFSDFKRVHTGMIVKGKVLALNDNEVYLDISYKSDAVLPIDEVSNTDVKFTEIYNVGDEIEVEVVKMNDGEGNVVASRKSLEKEEYMDKLNKKKEEGSLIEVVIDSVNKGGFACRYKNVKAFMPLSLSGINRGEADSIIGKKLSVNISEVKQNRGNIELVVSRKEIVMREKEEKINKTLNELVSGETYKGTVKGIIDPGVFVNIGVIDVFVPISELVWRRINKPQDVVKIGDTVEVLITKVSVEDRRVTGSIKRVGIQPWEKFLTDFNVGDIVEGKVVNFVEFGAFVEIIDGVEGLVHISQIVEKRINKPQEFLRLGEKVKAKILSIDSDKRRISLSIREARV